MMRQYRGTTVFALASRWRRWLCAVLLVSCAGVFAGEADLLGGQTPAGSPEDWAFLDNGKIRIGVKKTSGAAIGWLSRSGGENLINHWDHGRLIQQSYYGQADGSLWAKKPWRWNPVQGGDYTGNPAKVLAFEHSGERLYAKTLPKHWASGADLEEVRMEEWISLEGATAHVRYRMTYSGTVSHPDVSHEIPAVFVDSHYDTLVVYDGPAPWTDAPVRQSVPGWPNESRDIAEHWAAYVNPQGQGAGVLVPIADRITCYRFGKTGARGACSYFAPITRFPITPGTEFTYDVYLTLGTAEEIRAAFKEIWLQSYEERASDSRDAEEHE